MSRNNRGPRSLHRSRAGRQSHSQAEKIIQMGQVSRKALKYNSGANQACVATTEPPSPRHADRGGCSRARQSEGQGARHSLQADVRGQLEGIF